MEWMAVVRRAGQKSRSGESVNDEFGIPLQS
jgi:hypothetical protein